MVITVEELLQLVFPVGSRVLGGRGGLQREVSWARSLRPRPPVFDAIEGGELALLSSVQLARLEEPMTLAHLIGRLADAKVSAVAVLGEVRGEAVEAADRRDVPLIQLPEGASLHDLERAAVSAVVDRQAELQRRAMDIHRHLSQLTFEERGLQSVAEGLAQICGRSVAIEDDLFRLQFGAAGPDLPHPSALDLAGARVQVEKWVRGVHLSSTQPPVERFPLLEAPLARFVAPIPSRDGVAGYLSVIGPEMALSEVDRQATARGAAVCALEFAKSAAVAEAEARMRGDLLDQLLFVGAEPDQATLGKARRLGYDPALPSVVVVLRVSGAEKSASTRHARESDRLRRHLESLARTELSRSGAKPLVAIRGGTVVAVVPMSPGGGAGEVEQMVEGLRRRARLLLGEFPVAAGIGRPTRDGATLSTAYHEAERALSIGLRVNGPASTTLFGSLGIMRLLAQIDTPEELESFRTEWLGRLEEHDRKSGGELQRTLEALFECNGNLSRTADRLSLHRNSLLYRLRRIEEISGYNLEDYETRLALQVALKLRHLPARSPAAS